MLKLLVSKPGETFSSRDILAAIWGYGDQHLQADWRVVDVHISRLRRKLNDTLRHLTLILTAIGQGYRFGISPSDQPSFLA